jgi:hypothetical protein
MESQGRLVIPNISSQERIGGIHVWWVAGHEIERALEAPQR